MIAVNDAYRLAPWADMLYGCDEKWWAWHDGAPGFAGIKVALKWCAENNRFHDRWTAENWPGIRAMASTGNTGLELRPGYLRTGGNSGYQAINLAVQLGAARILLLGYDAGGGTGNHWFGQHPAPQDTPFKTWLDAFGTLPGPLKAAGVEVVNCTPGSAIEVFPKGEIEREIRHGSHSE